MLLSFVFMLVTFSVMIYKRTILPWPVFFFSFIAAGSFRLHWESSPSMGAFACCRGQGGEGDLGVGIRTILISVGNRVFLNASFSIVMNF
jgi:hypothetical protein